jgi:nickel-dependent lactate racemase
MSRIPIEYGHDRVEVVVADECLIPVQRAAVAANLSDPAAAVTDALRNPLGFPPLRQALTPDDHVVMVVAEDIGRLAELMSPLLELLSSAGVQIANVTAVCLARTSGHEDHSWRGDLPERFRDVAVEVHDPAERRKLSYLASTKAGRRIYLNRTLVDADQLILVGRFGYDPVLGYGGGLADVFPALSDSATREELGSKPSDALPGAPVRPAWNEAQEVGWLLGMPFLLQVIEGTGDGHCHILAGSAEAVTQEGHRLLEQRWRVTVDHPVELVVAGMSGSPGHQSIATVTRALANAARVVQPSGKIAVLSHAGPELGPGMRALRQLESVAQGLMHARQHQLPDAVSVWQLAHAAQHAKLYLQSDIPMTTVEELFMIPLEQPHQVQRLIDAAGSCIILPDAHRTLAVVRK